MAQAAAKPMREIFTPGEKTQIVKLRFNTPLETETKYGTRYQYTIETPTSRDAVMWLNAAQKEAIEATGAKAGDEIAIAHTARGKWEISKVEEEPEPQACEQARITGTDHPGESFPLADSAAIALRAAARAAHQIECEMQKQFGRRMEFTTEDIRSFAQSIWNQERGGRK